MVVSAVPKFPLRPQLLKDFKIFACYFHDVEQGNLLYALGFVAKVWTYMDSTWEGTNPQVGEQH
ncbi:hypothetical protein BRO07_11665 [Xanthomonas oryzae pv. oryzae]|nr:hypothetical protein BRN29_25125 [Xanthomonas oryzae pv. oryzae]RBC19421.1 hypothetical protein BRN26_21635 [Xanthomonas oryzae pv. oryzae]RBC60637.1 hypothetical protein BRN15_12980 [Xanthomonas oryzae pv. oryzae]RBC69444.1 hypothetical protein BRM99_24685 [Xanthomonas oryzae pv. oryzae]RBE52270.1 hypothetical protein BRL78_07100 [Xanthomonas oryzae pv. oryzae]